ncbi:hypothetical protein [Phaeovulum sp.]|uniref:hypothetical protein n=1 Tax=Phaeovulum sp. TaxID=2934796 RepID=UPI0039E27802
MHKKPIVAVALSLLAATATAAPFEAPYSLSAVHADFQAQLEQTAQNPGTVGTTARIAADLMGPHNAAQERLILPILGLAETATGGRIVSDPQMAGRLQALKAELAQINDSDVNLVIALVELYAAADEAGQPDITRLAERMIWHEVSDVNVLYPAALLVGASLQTQMNTVNSVGP